MQFLNQTTNDTAQRQTIILDDGTSFVFAMYFIPMQYGWFIREITYGAFTVQGIRISNNPNMLYQFKNTLPFGLACLSTTSREPSQQNDFSSGASALYLLSAAEVVTLTEIYNGEISV